MPKTRAQIDREVKSILSGSADSTRRETTATRRRRPKGARTTAITGAIYRPIGREGDPWPHWLVDLGKTSGAYVIQDAGTRRPLYAGSAKNNLYATITRHFQQWKRRKKWWKGQYGAGHDPGLVYVRSKCDVAIWITSEEHRLEKETQLITRLRPRDNLVEHPDGELEEAPF